MTNKNQSLKTAEEMKSKNEQMKTIDIREIVETAFSAGLVLATDPKYKLENFIAEKDKVINAIVESYASQQSTEVKTQGATTGYLVKIGTAVEEVFVPAVNIAECFDKLTAAGYTKYELVHHKSFCILSASQSLPQQPTLDSPCLKCKETEDIISKEPVNFLLSNALRYLSADGLKMLSDNLLERLPQQPVSATPQPTGGMQELIDKIKKRMDLLPDNPAPSERASYDAYLNCLNWAEQIKNKL